MAKAPDPTALRREAAGRYRSGDGRFSVESAGAGWLVSDAEQADDLGLPLVRGPFATLVEARAAIAAARSGPAPVSNLTGRRRPAARPPEAPPAPKEPPVEIRPVRPGDFERLRALWASIGMAGLGDDDAALGTLIRRNPGLSLLATRGDAVVASALAAWDGRRGWLYHVAVAPELRRRGIGIDLVRRIEARLAELGAPKVNAVVQDDNPEAAGFWRHAGYTMTPARQYGRELGVGAPGPAGDDFREG